LRDEIATHERDRCDVVEEAVVESKRWPQLTKRWPMLAMAMQEFGPRWNMTDTWMRLEAWLRLRQTALGSELCSNVLWSRWTHDVK
jgi:hypothetical protein